MLLAQYRGRKALFWCSMLVTQIAAFFLFKDLADISQWVVRSSREEIMTVWYWRYPITLLAFLGLALSLFVWFKDRQMCGPKVLAALVVLSLLNVYSGLVNPLLMFRSQQHDAKFVAVAEARPYLERTLNYARFGRERYDSVDDISVMALVTDQGAIAYTDYFILQPHVADGGKIGGKDVVMTYCGLTNVGIAYSPEIGGKKLDLGVMTQLQNNLVMFDRNSGEPVQQLWGRLEGARELGRMREWPTIRMPFRAFAKLYPEGKVYVNEIPEFAEHPIKAVWDRLTRHVMMWNGVSLQWNSDEPAFPTIKEFDRRLPRKTLIYGFNVGYDYVAYTKDFIKARGNLVNVKVGGRDIVVSYSTEYDTVGVFYNDTGRAITNVDVMGNTESGRLPRVETLKNAAFWFIWANFFKQTDVNRV